MGKFLVTASALGLLLSFASAQDAEEEFKVLKEGVVKREINRNVPSGKTWNVWFLVGADDNCLALREEARTTKEPKHGTVEIVSTVKVTEFAKEGPAAKCNGKKMRGLDINYKSSRGYTGPDEFDLLVMLPFGKAGSSHGREWEMHFKFNCVEQAIYVGNTMFYGYTP